MEVNGLTFLLDIDVAKIKSTHEYVEEYYKIEFPEQEEDYPYIIDEREQPHKDAVDSILIEKATKKIANFIDIETPYYDGKNILDDLGLRNRVDLSNFLKLVFDVVDLHRMIKYVDFYILKVKGIFLKNAIEMLDLKKEFPSIQLSNKINIEKSYREHMAYTYPMLCLQPLMEYSAGIIFPENQGKAYMDHSWREQELKRLYLTAKTKKDNFTESVYAKKNEEHIKSNKK